MLTNVYLNVDDCWLTYSMAYLHVLLNYAIIPENVISKDEL